MGIDVKNSDNYEKTKRVFMNAENISVRDIKSQELLESFGISSVLENDPVFYDNENWVEKKSVI